MLLVALREHHAAPEPLVGILQTTKEHIKFLGKLI